MHDCTENSCIFFANRLIRKRTPFDLIEFVNEIFTPFVTKKLLSLFHWYKRRLPLIGRGGKIDPRLLFSAGDEFSGKTILSAYEFVFFARRWKGKLEVDGKWIKKFFFVCLRIVFPRSSQTAPFEWMILISVRIVKDDLSANIRKNWFDMRKYFEKKKWLLELQHVLTEYCSFFCNFLKEFNIYIFPLCMNSNLFIRRQAISI